MLQSIEIREYRDSDKSEVLNLLTVNTPQFFAPEEAKDFANYLEHERECYYVLLCDQKIVGCGGINFEDNYTIGKLSWDIVHPEFQGRSLGKRLLKYRVVELLSMESIQKITVRTSQVAFKFYKKQGFELLGIKKDYWAKGFDLYAMEYKKWYQTNIV